MTKNQNETVANESEVTESDAAAETIALKAIEWEQSQITLTIGSTGAKAKYKAATVNLDLATLPAESIVFALRYGLKQYIADGTAMDKDLASQSGFDAGVADRVRKLLEADFKRTSGGERGPRTDTPEGRARKLAATAIRKHLKDNGLEAEAKAVNEAAAKQVENNPKWLVLAKQQLADEAALTEADDFEGLFPVAAEAAPEGDEA